jgi:allophanate hydrolase
MSAATGTMRAVDRPEAWICRRDPDSVLAEARAVDDRVRRGERLPLAGMTVAVKDNIDVAGLPTTAGCPAYAYTPAVDAPVVARVRAAGAIVLGKTNMDQFATGLVGTRSPYGAVRDVRDPARVAGGSSSGSAVAVALEIADLALGTDTAGSGRVPAAFQGIVGLKPTRGLVPMTGVVPACRSFDCVSVFARSLADAELAFAEVASGWPQDAPLAAPPTPRVAVAAPAQLELLTRGYARAYTEARDRIRAIGCDVVEIDVSAILEAGTPLYGGAFVAERYAAVGSFIESHPDAVDPVVREIILGGRSICAERYLAEVERLDELRVAAAQVLCEFDALMLPTAPFQPTIDEVAASPLEINAQLGAYTSFCNLLDMCAVSVPAGEADGGCFGVTLYAPAFHDRLVAELAGRFAGVAAAPPSLGALAGPPSVQLLVFGAHMTGEPLNGELTTRGGRLLGQVRTAPSYRFYRLATTPPKPGLVRVDDGSEPASIEGELWALPPAGLASLLAELPAPMALGRVTLDDGSEVVGFLCEPAALSDAQDITSYGGWRGYLRA